MTHTPVNIVSQSGEQVDATFIDLSAGSQDCQTQSSTAINAQISQIVGSLASAYTHPSQNVGSAVSVGNQPINRIIEMKPLKRKSFLPKSTIYRRKLKEKKGENINIRGPYNCGHCGEKKWESTGHARHVGVIKTVTFCPQKEGREYDDADHWKAEISKTNPKK